MEAATALASLLPVSLSPSLLFTVLALGVAVLLLLRPSSKASSLQPFPPSPRGLPIIGHLHLLGTLPHQAFARLSKTHGPLFSVRLGAITAVVACSSDLAMQILQTHDKVCAGRPQNLSAPKTIFGCPEILFSPPSPYWRLLRQICATEFFSNKRFEFFRPVRNDEVGRLMLKVLNSAGKSVAVRENVQSTNNNVMSRMVLGKRLLDLARGSGDSIVSIIVEIIALVGVFNLGDYFPSIAWMDLQGYGKRSRDAARKARIVFQEVIDKRRSIRSQDEPPRDFLDMLLISAADKKNKEFEMKDINLRAMLIDMYAGGTDTAAVTTEWAMSELLANPEKLKKLVDEIDGVVGKERLVQEEDLPKMPYLLAVIMETMRLHPVAPLLAPHSTLADVELGGYLVPANTMLYVNVWAIHRDPEIWEEPLEFRPERFIEKEYDLIGQQFHYMPFGSGRRFCPGWKLGLISVQVALSNLLHAFEWRVSEKPDRTEKFGIVVTKANPLLAIPKPRLPLHLYEGYTVNAADAVPR
ncbi:hypothetical protein KP509_28G052200 [Ceratopteris richardii]|uniref:Cytochrome P450 n=1 Tax=Ceratopteris richardii TaxID=49495 RepID=A0A8T2REF0_CERRI|nr:hypothetical protein KP509_28G052200 [Ceratopteris richardii]